MKIWFYNNQGWLDGSGEIANSDPLPQRSTSQQPPSMSDWPTGHRPRWVNEQWELQDFVSQTSLNEPTGPKTWDSTIAFLREFTQQERIDINSSTETDPVVKDFLFMLGQANIVQSDDDDLIAGMQYLVDQGYLTIERRDQIMDNS